MSLVPSNSKLKRWAPSPEDRSHYAKFRPLYGAVTPEFPVTLGRTRLPILDQGMTDECTDYMNAMRAAYKNSGQMFSHEWFGAKEGEIVGASIINGASPQSALAVPNTFGGLPLSAQPAGIPSDPAEYLNWLTWPMSVDAQAAPFMEIASNFVDGPYDAFDNIRTVLEQAFAENQVVCVFSSWYDEFNDPANKGIFPIPATAPISDHAHLFIDWENVNGEPMLVDHLSQGVEFAANGFAFWNRALVNWMAQNGNMGCYIFRTHPQQNAIVQAIMELDTEAIEFAKRIIATLTTS